MVATAHLRYDEPYSNFRSFLALKRSGLNFQAIPKNLEIRTLVFLMLSVVIMFLLRSIWTIPIEVGGDAVTKFYTAAEIIRTKDWALLLQNHHTMRWGIMLPQIFLTWFVGIKYEVYYILPLLSFALYFVIILYALKDHLNTSQKILLGVLLFVEPMSFRTTSQLMTVAPSVFYVISACFILSSYSKRSNFAVVVAAGLFFCAYGSHATYMSFSVGGFLWLAFVQRSWRSALIFAGTLIGLLIAESIIFNYLSGWELKLGRLESLFFGRHIQGVPGKERYSVAVAQLFTRWFKLPILVIALCAIFFIGSLVLLGARKKHVLPGFVSCVYLVGVCFALFASFALVSIDPIHPVQRLLPRYLSPFMPFLIIVSVYFLSLIIRSNKKIWNIRMEILAALLSFSVLVTPQFFDHSFLPHVKIRPDFFIWKAENEYTGFARRFHDGKLILTNRKQRVLAMIGQFKYPVGWIIWKNGQSAVNRSLYAKCVSELELIPINLNYRVCSAEELE